MFKGKSDKNNVKDGSYKSKDFFEIRIISIKNFNRLFNTCIFILNLLLFLMLKYLENTKAHSDDIIKLSFLSKAMIVNITSLFLNISICIIIQKYNKTYYEAIAIANNLLFSLFFQILAGLLRSFLFITSDPLLFITSLEIIVRYLIVSSKYPSFKITMGSTILILFYNWSSMIIYHKKVPFPIISYNAIQTLVFILLASYSKMYENNEIIESEAKKTKENERNYFVDILDNLNVGFFITQGAKINLYNKFVANLMDNYQKNNNALRENEFNEADLLRKATEKAINKHHDDDPLNAFRFLYEEKEEEGDDCPDNVMSHQSEIDSK